MNSKRIGIIDYTLGNLPNVARAVSYSGHDPIILSNPKNVKKMDAIILPGVGAFSVGIQQLESSGMADSLRAYALSGMPLLGICLGMQMLMTSSEENGYWDGLNLIPGTVRKFTDSGVKIPQIGWNTINPATTRSWEKTFLKGIEEQSDFYFIHSYFVKPDNENDTLAYTQYGTDTFCSVISRDTIMGCQFHPEKSGAIGLQIISNFIEFFS